MPRDFIREKKTSDLRLIRHQPDTKMIVALDVPSTKLRMIDDEANDGRGDGADDIIYRPTTTTKKSQNFWKTGKRTGYTAGKSRYQVAGIHDDVHNAERVDLTGRKIRTSTASREVDDQERNKNSLMLDDHNEHLVWWKRFRFKLVLGLVIATILTSILVPIFIKLRKRRR